MSARLAELSSTAEERERSGDQLSAELTLQLERSRSKAAALVLSTEQLRAELDASKARGSELTRDLVNSRDGLAAATRKSQLLEQEAVKARVSLKVNVMGFEGTGVWVWGQTC